MKQFAIFRQTTTGFRVFLLIFLLLLLTLLSILSAALICSFVFKVPLSDLESLTDGENGIYIAKIVQIISQIGVFILPPLLFAILVSEKPLRLLGINNRTGLLFPLLGIVVMFSILPLIHQLTELNESIRLPSFMKQIEYWMQEKEKQAGEISLKFLAASTLGGLSLNLLMIGILPAVGEELLFRSILQPLFGKILRNHHFGILVSAILFSMMHMQFYGFFPRVALGLLLGYFYLWSGSILIPMLMHFVNNGSAVVIFYLSHNGYIETKADEFGATSNSSILFVSILATAGLVYLAYRNKKSPEYQA